MEEMTTNVEVEEREDEATETVSGSGKAMAGLALLLGAGIGFFLVRRSNKKKAAKAMKETVIDLEEPSEEDSDEVKETR